MQAGKPTTDAFSKPARFLDWLRRIDAPVLVQEMRVRQRGLKPFAVMLVYLLILSVAGLLMLYNNYPHRPTASRMAELGGELFATLSIVQLIMVCLIVPAYSSASVCGERERGTFDLLSLTLLSSSAIVTQKLIAAMGQALMLIFASLPIMAVVFLLGGVSPVELLVAYGLILVTAVFLGSLGMLCSCLVKSSKTSTFLTYLIMFCLFFGLPLGNIWLESLSGSYGSSSSLPMPVSALILLFVSGVGAALVYSCVSLILHNRPVWRRKELRTAVFGGVYALMLLLATCSGAADLVLNSGRSRDIPLTLYINPFAALGYYITWSFGGMSSSTPYWIIGVTAAFCVGCTLLFRLASSAKFAGLRRS